MLLLYDMIHNWSYDVLWSIHYPLVQEWLYANVSIHLQDYILTDKNPRAALNVIRIMKEQPCLQEIPILYSIFCLHSFLIYIGYWMHRLNNYTFCYDKNKLFLFCKYIKNCQNWIILWRSFQNCKYCETWILCFDGYNGWALL